MANPKMQIDIVADPKQAQAAVNSIGNTVSSLDRQLLRIANQIQSAFSGMANQIRQALDLVSARMGGLDRQARGLVDHLGRPVSSSKPGGLIDTRQLQTNLAGIEKQLPGIALQTQTAFAGMSRTVNQSLDGVSAKMRGLDQQAKGLVDHLGRPVSSSVAGGTAAGMAGGAGMSRTGMAAAVAAGSAAGAGAAGSQNGTGAFQMLGGANSRKALLDIFSQNKKFYEASSIDATQEVLAGIQKKMAKAGAAFAKSEEEALKKLNGAAKESTGWFSKLTSGAGLMKTAFSVLAAGGIATVASTLYNLVSAQSEAAEGMVNMADRTGLSINQVDRLTAMSKVAGVNINSLENSSRTLSVALEDTSITGSKAWGALDKLGISAYTSGGKQREMGQILWDVMKKLSSVKSDSERTAMAISLLGRGAIELMPLIKNFDDLDKKARDMGYGTRESLVKALAEANDQLDQFNNRWTLLKAWAAEKITFTINVVTKTVGNANKTGVGKPNNSSLIGMFAAPENQYTPEMHEKNTDFVGYSMKKLLADRRAGADPAFLEVENKAKAQASRSNDFRTRLSNTPEGQLSDLKEKLNQAQKDAMGGVMGAADSYFKLVAQIKALEASMKAGGKDIDKDAFVYKTPGIPRDPKPSLLKPGEFTSRNQIMADFGPSLGGTVNRGQIGLDPEQVEMARQRSLDVARQEAEYQIKKIDLMTGPGGEADAAREIAKIKLGLLYEEQLLGEDNRILEQKRLEVLREQETSMLAAARQRWNELRNTAGEIFDQLLTRTRSWGDVFKNILLNVVLTPFKLMLTAIIADMLSAIDIFSKKASGAGSGGGWKSTIQSGIQSAFGKGGKSSGQAPQPVYSPLPATLSGSVMMANPLNAQPGGQSGGMSGGVSGMFKNMSVFGNKSAQGIFGQSGKMGAYGGAVQGGLAMGGTALAMDGWKRGGWAGAAEMAGGGAAIGMAYGGPVGAAVGAAVGFGVGAIKAVFFKSPAEKIKKEVKKIYGVDIDKQFAKSLADMSKGQDLRIFLRSAQVREMIDSYKAMTNQKSAGSMVDDKARGIFLEQSGGALGQAATYVNGSAYGYQSSLPSFGNFDLMKPSDKPVTNNVTLQIAGEAAASVMRGQMVQIFQSSPALVSAANNKATSTSNGRVEAAINLTDPLGTTI